MKVRFTHLAFSPEKIEEAKQVYTIEIAPVIRAHKGNREVLFLESEKAPEEFISCTVWETEEDLKAFEESPEYRQVIGRIKQLATRAEQKYYTVV
ncbi:MAG: antibiotic biosynthesis monooxygenase [Williamsia sp.]|nr:antibiotic biosynthesis monooxygenase [Williamsia sp.]